MAAGDVTSIHPNGSAITRIHPVDDTADSGGGTVIDYTTFKSPWVAEDPLVNHYFGPNIYETAANATFFTADAPTVYYSRAFENAVNASFFVADIPLTETPF